MNGTIDSALTEVEKIRRREQMRDQHAAVKAGMSFEEFQQAREERVQRWIDLFHSEMQRAHADDPTEVLPVILAKVEEAALVAARAIAKREAETIVKQMLRRAIT
jgi:hypothetical protein